MPKREAVQGAIESYFAANEDQNIDRLAELIAHNVSADYPSECLQGREAYIEHMKGTYALTNLLIHSYTVRPILIVIDGVVAIAKWRCEIVIKYLCIRNSFEGYNEFTLNAEAQIERIATKSIKKNLSRFTMTFLAWLWRFMRPRFVAKVVGQ